MTEVTQNNTAQLEAPEWPLFECFELPESSGVQQGQDSHQLPEGLSEIARMDLIFWARGSHNVEICTPDPLLNTLTKAESRLQTFTQFTSAFQTKRINHITGKIQAISTNTKIIKVPFKADCHVVY